VNSHDELTYRLELAEGYLQQAEADYVSSKWHGCMANAQESVENAGKAIVSCFAPVARSHHVVGQLAEVLQTAQLPADLRQALVTMLPDFGKMGLAAHVRVTYGDERTFTPPWKLIQQPEAEAGLRRARDAVALGRRFLAYFSAPPQPEADKPD